MEYGIGTVVGVFAGVIIVLILMKIWNKDNKFLTRYDEMQQKARGKAYKYAFWTITTIEAIYIILTSLEIAIPFDDVTTHIIPILAGVLVQASYSIWNNAYIGLNTNMKRFSIIAIIIAIINLLAGIGAIRTGTMIVDGKFSFAVTNLICGFLFVTIGVECLIKYFIDKNNTEED